MRSSNYRLVERIFRLVSILKIWNHDIIYTRCSKTYSEHVALDHVSLEVPQGHIFGLLGPNGAGKTSLIRIITQITAPDSGRVIFDGEPLSERHVNEIGYLPEERGLYKKMKVGEQLMYLAQLKGMSRPEAQSKLKDWFIRLDIKDWWNKPVDDLSKGMQQKRSLLRPWCMSLNY